MKILYISQYFPPEMGAPAARVAELSRHWVRGGHEVTVLTGFPNHPTGNLAPGYRRKLWRLAMREVVNETKVVRTWLLPFPNGKPYERILNYVSFCISSAFTGLFISRPDVVIATSPQLLVGLSGWWLARFNRVPFVFEVRDLWPESLTAVGMGAQDSLLHRCLATIAKFLYRNSDRIVVVTPAFKQHIVEHMQIAAEKIFVVENGVETDIFDSRRADLNLRKELGLDSKFVVSYIGTMGMAHGLETLIEVAEDLQQSHPKILFLFVGEGSEKKRIRSIANSKRLGNVRFLSEQPRERIPNYICASDACVVLLKKSDVFKTVIPTKLLEFMSCERPVILGVDGQARQLVEQAGAGIFIPPENSTELTKAILGLARDPALRSELGRQGRNYVLQQCSRPRTAQTYLQVLQALLKQENLAGSLAA